MSDTRRPRIQGPPVCGRLFCPLGCRKPLACPPVPCAGILPYTTKERPLLAAAFIMSKHPIPPDVEPQASIQISNPTAGSPTAGNPTAPPPPPLPHNHPYPPHILFPRIRTTPHPLPRSPPRAPPRPRPHPPHPRLTTKPRHQPRRRSRLRTNNKHPPSNPGPTPKEKRLSR